MFVSARDWPTSAGIVEKTTMPFASRIDSAATPGVPDRVASKTWAQTSRGLPEAAARA